MLKTPFHKSALPFASYPRPQLVRDSYFCLNGEWDLTVWRRKASVLSHKVTVPFPPESAASGIGQRFEPSDRFEYRRSFVLPDGFVKDRVLLHFGAVDQTATVSVNGRNVITHEGGYLPFSCDITDVLTSGENELSVTVSDPLDTALPYGKQRRKRGGMWYTPISGIWQTVWLESVPALYIRTLRITPFLDRVTIEVDGIDGEKCLILGDKEYHFRSNRITLPIDDPQLWTPETPHLYPFVLRAGEDAVSSYFALRTMEVGQAGGRPCLLLNGKPYFFNGLLDQGYFADGIYLPSDEEGYRFDIRTVKSLGFNTLRKHIKIEPEVFYYECDKQGMIVFQDMVNNGRYSFLLDTALPTLGIRRRFPRIISARQKRVFEQHCRDTVSHLYNHPCVCYYTVFNEGWGQFDTDHLYREIKEADPTRVWDATSGWFFGKESDVQSEHVYFKPIKLKATDRPLVLSEFGGYSCKLDDHAFCADKAYGYRYFKTTADFEKALFALYTDEVLPAVRNGLCAAVLTQVSDVEDETNGLITYDRQVVKVEAAAMRDVCAQVQKTFEEMFG